jgi:putative ABC transport system ATP-binding protein
MRDRELARLRGQAIGFVFQAFHLLGHLTALDNVLAPMLFAPDASASERQRLAARAGELLSQVGLAGRGGDMPEQLSGGERQRVAIARALLMKPRLLLCDEPTGNLDLETGKQIVELFGELHGESDLTIVAVTHERALAGAADRIVHLSAGKVVKREDDAAEVA